MFIKPGISHLPAIDTRRAPSGTGTVAAGPMAVMRSPVMTTTASGIDLPVSISITVPPTRAVLGAAVCEKAAVANRLAAQAISHRVRMPMPTPLITN